MVPLSPVFVSVEMAEYVFVKLPNSAMIEVSRLLACWIARRPAHAQLSQKEPRLTPPEVMRWRKPIVTLLAAAGARRRTSAPRGPCVAE
ncbi:hypothetical protein AB1Y20_013812 [Prymnesium parvum]|uniref:Uncharacterized protein n=1 Tax=Prymnesium parvum TaxID=97485 RepID=A0AB34IGH4_PRYPA